MDETIDLVTSFEIYFARLIFFEMRPLEVEHKKSR
jgi:hypothetical protein